MLAKFSNSISASLLATKNSNYLSGQTEISVKSGFSLLKFSEIKPLFSGNKRNHLSVSFTAEKTTFDLSVNFKRLTSKDVNQIELKMFFTWEFLTNENINKNIWHLAKETGSRENFNKEKKLPRGYHSEKAGAFCRFFNVQNTSQIRRNSFLH